MKMELYLQLEISNNYDAQNTCSTDQGRKRKIIQWDKNDGAQYDI